MSTSPAPTQIAAIVLAAGGSTRLGYPKQLIEIDGQSMVRRSVLAAIQMGARPVVAVLGADSDKVFNALHGLTAVTTVINPDWKSGIASSLKTGILAAKQDSGVEAFMIILADQPLVITDNLRAMADAFDPTHRIVAAMYSGTIGVPAIFGVEYADEIMALQGDSGAGSWLRAHERDVTSVRLEGAAVDVDTLNDVAHLTDHFHRNTE